MQAATFHARGMHCGGCERVIEEGVRRLDGVAKIKADYATQTVSVTFDPAATSLDAICAVVAQKGYSCDQAEVSSPHPLTRAVGLVIGAAGIILIIFFAPSFVGEGGGIALSPDMSYGLLFALGLLTGFHCVAMCGAFVLSYTAIDARAGRPSYLSHILYGAGKTLSYTAIGGLFGLLGSVVTFTPLLRGGAGMLAGAFMIVFGLNMLELFPSLRRLRLRAPAWADRIVGDQARSGRRPFAIGLVNGLNIACGPLQALYIMAAGTGSALEGAKMLFIFGLGTLPVMLSFGLLSSLVSAALTHRLLKASGLILLILGAVMIHRGLILTGSGFDLHALTHALSPAHRLALEPLSGKKSEGFQTIEMEVSRSGYSPNHFTLQKGVPVRWVIDGVEITNCNSRIVVPRLGLEFDVMKGRQIIDFIPREAGVIPWSCWMGMLQGQFDVIDAEPGAAPEVTNKPASPPEAPSAPLAAGTEATAAKAGGEPPAVSPESSGAEAPGRYAVAAGDSLSRIAKKVYGDPRRWRAIAKANPGLDLRRLRPGQVILLPVGAPRD